MQFHGNHFWVVFLSQAGESPGDRSLSDQNIPRGRVTAEQWPRHKGSAAQHLQTKGAFCEFAEVGGCDWHIEVFCCCFATQQIIIQFKCLGQI